MRRYALRDDQWNRIKHLLPGKAGDVGVTAKANRLFAKAVARPLSGGDPLARSAGAVREFPGYSHAPYALAP